MSFLPIVERELRVAARKRSTFWLRVVAALVALIIGAGLMILTSITPIGTPRTGVILFSILTWLGMAAALGAGLFFTSDSLSQEKREGTLGFLFLTDLRGYDVVLGKLLATSLRGVFALLALLPILAVTLLMGGVTGAQFWKTALALVNALVCSLAVGLFVSAISRDPQKALAGTFLVLLILNAGGPAGDQLLAKRFEGGFPQVLSWSSPAYVFAKAGAWGRSSYWSALITSHLAAWILLATASALVPRTWQQRSSRANSGAGSLAHAWRYGGAARRTNLRRKLLARDPVLWLACRERWQSFAIWTLTIVWLGAMIVLLATKQPADVWAGLSYFGWMVSVVLYLWAASQAGRFFVEAGQSGLIELLLAAPLTEGTIVRGQWRGLTRMFGLPVLLLVIAQIIPAAIAQQSQWGRVAAATGNQGPDEILRVLVVVLAGVTTVANVIALSWFGMWMGVTSKNNSLATLKTLGFVQVIPWFIISFASALTLPLLMLTGMFRGGFGNGARVNAWSTQLMAWFPIITAGIAALLSLGKDVIFTLWARKRLLLRFRERASLQSGSNRQTTFASTPSIVAPPVILAQS
jgi:ABC-type transport system involved in multi-copper enzyme maturation permease subunit